MHTQRKEGCMKVGDMYIDKQTGEIVTCVGVYPGYPDTDKKVCEFDNGMTVGETPDFNWRLSWHQFMREYSRYRER